MKLLLILYFTLTPLVHAEDPTWENTTPITSGTVEDLNLQFKQLDQIRANTTQMLDSISHDQISLWSAQQQAPQIQPQ